MHRHIDQGKMASINAETSVAKYRLIRFEQSVANLVDSDGPMQIAVSSSIIITARVEELMTEGSYIRRVCTASSVGAAGVQSL